MDKFNMSKVNAYISLEKKGIALTQKERAYLDAYRTMLEEVSKPVFRAPREKKDSIVRELKRPTPKTKNEKETVFNGEDKTDSDTKGEE